MSLASTTHETAPLLPAATYSDRGRRVVGAAVAIVCMAVLGLAAWLEPAAEGHGTHEQLGLPQCSWITAMDLPCPTCGMTTAFAHAANGSLPRSFLTQPLGCLLALTAAMATIVGTYTAVTGSRLGAVVGKLWRPRTGWILTALVLLAWGFKILTHKGII